MQNELTRLDKAHVWHPFTQMKEWMASEPLIIESGDGCELIDVDGVRYLDGVSSLWVNVHGHRVLEIDQAIRIQLDQIAHSTLLGLANVPSIKLAGELVNLAPKSPDRSLTRVFYSETGACAVEIALKMAYSYWQHKGVSSKRTFLSLDNAYHGDTLGAVSVGGIDLFHAAFKPLLFDSFRAPSPYCYRCPLGKTFPTCDIACLAPLREILQKRHREICAVVVEPLVQAAGGMITAPTGYLRRLSELCSEFDVLLIADEVATGAGRTGTFFACEQEGVVPDILVAGKGLTGGYLPLAVTMTSEAIFEAFLGDPEDFRTFYHGHTYTGNPLSCAAALANLELMATNDTVNHASRLGRIMQSALAPLWEQPHVGDIRRTGLMCGIELVADKPSRRPYEPVAQTGKAVAQYARSLGVIIRPLGDVIVLMPPLAISEPQLNALVAATGKAIAAVTC